MEKLFAEDTIETRIEEIKWDAQQFGWTVERERELIYYTMLNEIEKRCKEINEL